MKKQNFFQVKNITETKAELYIYGDIVSDEWGKWADSDVCPTDVINALKTVSGKDLDIYINSCGGSVFAGIAIYNMLKRQKGRKTVRIDSIAGSIASVIAMAGDEIFMYKNSFMVIHKPVSFAEGNAEDMRKCADELDKIQDIIQGIYDTKLKDEIDLNTIIDMINNETWLTAEDTAKYFNINVLEENKAAAHIKTAETYKNIPENAKGIFWPENNLEDEFEEFRDDLEDESIKEMRLRCELLSM